MVTLPDLPCPLDIPLQIVNNEKALQWVTIELEKGYVAPRLRGFVQMVDVEHTLVSGQFGVF